MSTRNTKNVYRHDTHNNPLKLSDEVDLEMYSSPNKGITPLRQASSKNTRGNFRVHRNYKPIKKPGMRSRDGSMKQSKESSINGMSANSSRKFKRYGSVPKKLVDNTAKYGSFPYVSSSNTSGVFNYPVVSGSNIINQK